MSPVHLTSKYFDQQLEVVREFTYVSSTVTESLSLDSELNKRIELAKQQTPYLVCQRENVDKQKNLTVHTTFMVYLACAQSALSYGSESWTLRANHERKLNIFTMQYIRRLLNIVFSLCKHWRMRLLSYVVRMDEWTFPTGRTQLRYKYVCKWDLKFLRQTSRNYKPKLLTTHIADRLWMKS